MKCINCGNEILENDMYCPSCGVSVVNQKLHNINKNDISIPKIIMGVILILFSIVSIYYLFTGINSDITPKGSWKCGNYTESISIDDDSIYYFEMDIRKDGTFSQYSLSNANNQFNIKGTYEYEISSKQADNVVGYFDLYLSIYSVTQNGNTPKVDSTSHYEFGILSNKKNALVINMENNFVYICKRI